MVIGRMLKKINSLLLYMVLCIFLIFILSLNVIAAENNRLSLFDDISKFIKSIFKEEKDSTNNIYDSIPADIKQAQLIELERLQNIINPSSCIQQLPKNSAIKLNIFDEGRNKNEFFISYGSKIDLYSGQKTDLDIGLSLSNILLMEKSINVDGDLKGFMDSKNLELGYNLLKALKYRTVLSCIENSKIVTKEPEKIQEEEVLINEAKENVTPKEVEPIKFTIIDKEELAPKKLKYLFDDFNNNVPYIVISNDSSDYSNLRAIKLLANWNYAVGSIDYSSIKSPDSISNKNLIFITNSCSTEISSLTTNEEECSNLIEGKKGIINFYEDDNRNVLVIIGNSGQDLVDSLSILSSYGLFEFNESDTILVDNSIYEIAILPEKLKAIQEELKFIYKKLEEYEFRVSNQEILTVPTYHAGQFFRDVSADISGGRFGYHILGKEEIEGLNRYDFGELARKGDNFENQRKLVQKKIKSLKSQIGTGIIYRLIDKNSINFKTLQEFESNLENSQKSFEDLNKDYEILTINMTPEIDRKMLDIRRLIGE